jgi:hypothetical protein
VERGKKSRVATNAVNATKITKVKKKLAKSKQITTGKKIVKISRRKKTVTKK